MLILVLIFLNQYLMRGSFLSYLLFLSTIFVSISPVITWWPADFSLRNTFIAFLISSVVITPSYCNIIYPTSSLCSTPPPIPPFVAICKNPCSISSAYLIDEHFLLTILYIFEWSRRLLISLILMILVRNF